MIERQSPGLNNDQGNRRRVEENIRRTTANTVECDDKMEVDYRKDERTNKQGFENLHKPFIRMHSTLLKAVFHYGRFARAYGAVNTNHICNNAAC